MHNPPNLEAAWELRWKRTSFKKSNSSFQNRKGRVFYKKKTPNITKISKSNFIYLIWHKTYKNCFVPFLNFSTTSKEKKGILIHLMGCTASDMWKEAPERSTKNQSAWKIPTLSASWYCIKAPLFQKVYWIHQVCNFLIWNVRVLQSVSELDTATSGWNNVSPHRY